MSGHHWTIEDYVLVQQVHFENQMTLDMQCSLYVDNCAKMAFSTYGRKMKQAMPARSPMKGVFSCTSNSPKL